MKRIPARNWIFGLLALALAGLFIRLGVWQLHRLGERRARNTTARERLALPPIRLRDEPGPGMLPPVDSVAGRRIQLRGRYDYAAEIVLRAHSFEGSPGVYVVTPLRIPGAHEAIPVLRGWMPAADGLHADLAVGRPEREAWGDVVKVEGIAHAGSRRGPIPPQRVELGGEPHMVLSTLAAADVAGALPYPVVSFYVWATPRAATPGASARTGGSARSGRSATSGRAERSRLPLTLPPPAFGDGPHLSYAIQWFAFAVISLVGTGAYLRKFAGATPA